MFDFKNSTLEEFWEYVATHLESNGIGVTLVGGAVATIYSKGKYESGDLDLVFGSLFQDRSEFEKVLNKIGIRKIDQRNFKHPDSPYSLEAKLPPIDIGHMAPEGEKPEIQERDKNNVVIKLLSPTDCIKDRLYKADEWNDDEAFDAAIAVAKEVGFSESKLKEFCRLNKKEEICKRFLNKLSSKK